MTTVASGSALKERVHARLVAEAGQDLVTPSPAMVRERLAEYLRVEEPLLAGDRFDALLTQLVHEAVGLGVLEPILADPAVTEVMLNGPGRAFVERDGVVEPLALMLDASAIVRIAERVVAPLGLRLDRASPMVDARLADGSRLHAVLPPLAVDGPCVTIRRFGARIVSVSDFGVDGDAERFLRWMVRAGWNVLVAGATGAGKTTLLNALSRAIPAHERVLTIEETAELRLAQPHVVRLEARPANAEGVGAISVRDLVRAALRMRPDRIVVGEVRGGEALDMLQALNTGHDGSLCTLHANSPSDALRRLETLALFGDVALPLVAIRQQIGASVDAVVAVGRDGPRRVVREIAEIVTGGDGSSTRALFRRERGVLVAAAAAPSRAPRRAGVAPWSPEVAR
jgi:pilus assembly protein CpaF